MDASRETAQNQHTQGCFLIKKDAAKSVDTKQTSGNWANGTFSPIVLKTISLYIECADRGLVQQTFIRHAAHSV